MRFKILVSLGFLSSLIINFSCKIKNSNSFLFSTETELHLNKATEDQISNFSNLVPNYQYFTKLDSEDTFGYIEVQKSFSNKIEGLCEYISLGIVLTYFELFFSKGFFNDWEWDKYFKINDSFSKPTMPTHKYYKKEDSSLYLKSLYYNLCKKNNYNYNLKSGFYIVSAFNNFLSNKAIASKIESNYSAAWWHTSSPEDYLLKHNIPIIFTFVENLFGHTVVIYGYDKKTNSYLVHFGWPYSSTVIIKKSYIWDFFTFGFWNAFYFNSKLNKNAPRKAFRYQNQNYSWQELQEQGISWDQL